ncbi:MAG TPA: peptide ABC transporter substrate-binding protein [Spirochaetales bacterium]|nr:peptide ABC transporter substrate-binding protein [Spirochaetales bacterium]
MKRIILSLGILWGVLGIGYSLDPPKELVVAFLPGEISLNPINAFSSSEAQLYTALYEGLVSYHPATLDPVPATAGSWEVSPDGKTYIFRIREEARYSNGDPVTAADFRNSWLKFLHPDSRAEYSFLYDIIEGANEYRTGKNPDPESVQIKALTEKRLQVVLEYPSTHFLKILCHHSFVPIHPSLLDKKDWNTLPEVPGNGPYVLAEKGPNTWVMKKNPYYWEADHVFVETIRILFEENPLSTTQKFNDYEIHWVTGGMVLDQVLYKDTVIVNPLFATYYFFFSNRLSPWMNPQVRRALALLIPWEIVRSWDFQFLPAKTLVPSLPRYPAPETLEKTDREEAFALLQEAGYPEGKGLPPIVFKIPEGEETRRTAAIFAAAWKEALDLDSEIQTFPYPDYLTVLKKGDYALGTVTWIGDFADPLTFLQMWTTHSNLNDAGYSNEEFDALILKSFQQTGEERYKTLSAAESLLLKSGEVLPIGHTPAINLIDLQFVDGWYPNPLDIHPFKYVRFTPFKLLPGVIQKEEHFPNLVDY